MTILNSNEKIYKNMFFILIICINFIFTEYPFTIISFIFSILYNILLKGFYAAYKNIIKFFPFIIFISALSSFINYLMNCYDNFNIFRFLSYLFFCINYSLSAISIIFWCESFGNHINDLLPKLKNFFPKVAITISIVLGMVPKFIDDFKLIINSQKCSGNIYIKDNLANKIFYYVNIFKIFLRFELLNIQNISQLLYSKQYSNKLYFFKKSHKKQSTPSKEKIIIRLYMLLIFFMSIILKIQNTQKSILPYILLCLVPITINILEVVRWNLLKQKI